MTADHVTTRSPIQLHPDFENVRVQPGVSDIVRRPELFDITNILALGAEVDRHPHLPLKVGQVGTAVFWESTGAADALPFWNTNLHADVLLFLVSGEVRVEFKELEGTEHYGSYHGRAGDLMLLPKDVAHRTFSGDGKRRVSLEVIQHDARWDHLDWVAGVKPNRGLRLDGLRFEPGPEQTVVDLDGTQVTTDSSFLLRGARAVVAYGLHLGHNEFEGGFVVADGDDNEVVLSVPGRAIRADRKAVVAVLKGLIAALEGSVDR